MNRLEELFLTYKKTGALHHAYLLETRGEIGNGAGQTRLIELIGLHVMPTRANQDFWHGTYESFGIDEGRMLKEMQQRRPSSGDKKVFVISTGSITREAQNSLLKMFEEPTEGSHFFLVMPSLETVLPTLLSRLQIVNALDEKNGAGKNGSISEGDMKAAQNFIKMSKPERLKFLAPMVEEGDRQKALVFLDSLERAVAAGKGIHQTSKQDQLFFAELYTMKSYLHDRSSSVKMILEHLALIL